MTRKAPRTGWTRAAIVAVMAYAFVLQALLLSVGGAIHAASAAEAQGVICIQDGSSAPDHGPTKAHENLCCTLSCHGSGPAGPAPVAAVPAWIAPMTVSGGPIVEPASLRLTSDVLPLGSRAPPRLG
jgi:predicted CxxxxCH...CXXCH cytochrome family protein